MYFTFTFTVWKPVINMLSNFVVGIASCKSYSPLTNKTRSLSNNFRIILSENSADKCLHCLPLQGLHIQPQCWILPLPFFSWFPWYHCSTQHENKSCVQLPVCGIICPIIIYKAFQFLLFSTVNYKKISGPSEIPCSAASAVRTLQFEMLNTGENVS
jgi:hypothetical protein